MALEWAAATLEDYYDDFYVKAMPSKKAALLQLAEGLHYVHSEGIVHCDLKPSNVLISNPNDLRHISTEVEPQVYLKIADFGVSKKISSGPFSLPLGNEEEQRWLAPETWCDEDVGGVHRHRLESKTTGFTQEKNYGFPIDTWALGCLFFSLMTKGHHPFGIEFHVIRGNILRDDPIEIESK